MAWNIWRLGLRASALALGRILSVKSSSGHTGCIAIHYWLFVVELVFQELSIYVYVGSLDRHEGDR